MIGAIELLVAGSALAAAAMLLKAGSVRQLQTESVTYVLSFPAGLEAEAVTDFLAALSGLLLPWWRRWVAQPVVVIEVAASDSGIEHRLAIPESVSGSVEAALTAHLPSVRYSRTEEDATSHLTGAEYRTNTDRRRLRISIEALSAGLLSSLQPLTHGEVVTVQWLLSPHGPIAPPRLRSKNDRQVSLNLTADLVDNAEGLSALKAKQMQPLLLAAGRIAVRAATRPRAEKLLRKAEAPWHGTRDPGIHLTRRLLPVRLVAKRVTRRSVPLLRFPAVLNTEEVASLMGWPVGISQLPGLTLGGCRLLPVSGAVPTSGTPLGTSTFPGTLGRPVALNVKSRLVHLHAMGPTGAGKSTLLTHIVLSDIAAGYGVVVLDPKGDLITPILERMDERRLDDVIVLDAADDERPVGYNPLLCTVANRELVVEQIHGVLHAIWRSSWGPRLDEILRASLLTLTAVPGMTLAEVPRLLTDEAFRRRVLTKVDDPFGVEGFWATFDSWSRAEQVTNTAAVLNKARAFAMRSRLRGVLGQSDGAINFRDLIANRGILLVNLAAGRLGTEAAYLLGALLFAGLWDAVSGRAGEPNNHRPPVMATMDEFQHLVALPTPAETVLAEARGYGLGMVLAHQHLGQLSSDLEQAVRVNARSKLLFATGRKDAVTLASELGGQLTPEDLMGIPAYEAVVSCYAAGSVQPPATIATMALPPALRSATEVYRRSRDRFGVDRGDVDTAMTERQQGGQRLPQQPVGRSRRTRR